MTPESTRLATPEPDAAKNKEAAPTEGCDRFVSWSHGEKAGRIAGFAALVAYAVGLLVVNTYLFQIGVTDFSVLRTRFILTGILVAVPPIALFIFVLMVALSIESVVSSEYGARSQARRLIRFRSIALNGIMPISLLAIPLAVILFGSDIDYRSSILAVDPWEFPVLLVVSAMGTILMTSFALSGWNRYNRTWKPSDLQKFVIWVFNISIAVFSFLLYIDFFASTFYPIIPEQFGGGKPKQVQIVLSEQSSALGAVLGFGPTTDGPIIRDVDLLWETEQMYVVRDRGESGGRIIQIDRDAVSAVVLGSDATWQATPAASPEAAP